MDNQLLNWQIEDHNGQKKIVQGTDLQVSQGALVVYLNQVPILGLSSGLWKTFQFLGVDEREDKNDLSLKLIAYHKSGQPYPGLHKISNILKVRERDAEWHLSNLLKNNKIPAIWLTDVTLQKSLDDIMPGLIRRHGKEMKMLLELLQQKNETRDADYIQLIIWLTKNPT